MRKLPLPRFLHEASDAMTSAAAHRRAASEARDKAAILLREVQDRNAQLNRKQRAERRHQIAKLREDARREGQEALRLVTTDLQARLPSWIKITK